MHKEIRYVCRQPEKERLGGKLCTNEYRIYAGLTPHGKTGIFLEQ